MGIDIGSWTFTPHRVWMAATNKRAAGNRDLAALRIGAPRIHPSRLPGISDTPCGATPEPNTQRSDMLSPDRDSELVTPSTGTWAYARCRASAKGWMAPVPGCPAQPVLGFGAGRSLPVLDQEDNQGN